ncbi:MAG: DUF748 domain-containing protein [Planctomycetota bacterium]|jgi:uncharacterized protein involved in outer membrane biogenesis
MKSKQKLIRTILGVTLILIACIVILVNFFGNSIIKTGIETVATKTLTVPVNIDDMDLSILGGKISFENLIIDNPQGYKHDKLLKVGDARIAVNIGSLLTDTVSIEEIMFDGVEVVIEQKGLTGNNLQDIINALPKGEKEPEEKTEKPQETDKPAKKLRIEKLELTNIKVKVELLGLDKVDAVAIKLDPIVMTDLGSDDKMDIAELSSKILLAIATGVAKQGAGILPEDMTDGLNTALGGITDIGKSTVKEGKKLIEGVENLFKPRK